MSGFELTASLVNSLAWPIITLIIIFILRKSIAANLKALSERFGQLKKLSAYGVNAEFEQEIPKVNREAGEILSGAHDDSDPLSNDSADDQVGHLIALSDTLPRSAILEACLQLETEAIKAAERRGSIPRYPGIFNYNESIDFLYRKKVIPKQIRDAVEELRRLRDLALLLPESDMSTSSARSYVKSAEPLARALRRIDGKNIITVEAKAD